MDSENSIKVIARIRPEFDKNQKVIITADSNTCSIHVSHPKDSSEKRNNFHLDLVFDQTTTQDDFFEEVAVPVIDNVLKGETGALVTFGAPNTGKTWTIEGNPDNYEECGFLSRVGYYMYNATSYSRSGNASSFSVSFFDVRNKMLHDMLCKDKKSCIKYWDVDSYSFYKSYPVTSLKDLIQFLNGGLLNRRSEVKKVSIKSHSIVTICVTKEGDIFRKSPQISMLHIVDLTGADSDVSKLSRFLSERRSLSPMELILSLICCYNLQYPKFPSLLQQHFGNISELAMIVTISPSEIYYDETISCLKCVTTVRNKACYPVVTNQGYKQSFNIISPEVSCPEKGKLTYRQFHEAARENQCVNVKDSKAPQEGTINRDQTVLSVAAVKENGVERVLGKNRALLMLEKKPVFPQYSAASNEKLKEITAITDVSTHEDSSINTDKSESALDVGKIDVKKMAAPQSESVTYKKIKVDYQLKKILQSRGNDSVKSRHGFIEFKEKCLKQMKYVPEKGYSHMVQGIDSTITRTDSMIKKNDEQQLILGQYTPINEQDQIDNKMNIRKGLISNKAAIPFKYTFQNRNVCGDHLSGNQSIKFFMQHMDRNRAGQILDNEGRNRQSVRELLTELSGVHRKQHTRRNRDQQSKTHSEDQKKPIGRKVQEEKRQKIAKLNETQ